MLFLSEYHEYECWRHHVETFFRKMCRFSTWITYETKYSKMDHVKFVEDSLWSVETDVSLQIVKSCLPQILLGPFLNIFPITDCKSSMVSKKPNTYGHLSLMSKTNVIWLVEVSTTFAALYYWFENNNKATLDFRFPLREK